MVATGGSRQVMASRARPARGKTDDDGREGAAVAGLGNFDAPVTSSEAALPAHEGACCLHEFAVVWQATTIAPSRCFQMHKPLATELCCPRQQTESLWQANKA